ncbi:prephenate dehydratase [Altericista sp. CCNU0014]|uniref:prephenate dehydratase n=1 Tax=Altericista sp. CCNU0014 TaxID=3082949 RepID=UPI00384ECA7D
MTFTIAHLGPAGTYAEQAASAYAQWWSDRTQQELPALAPFPSIAQTLYEVAEGRIEVAVVPVENSIEGSVTTTLDTLWQLETLQIRQALVLPIVHVLVAGAEALKAIQTVYSHPQALGQCQQWLHQNLPHAQLIPTHSTTEALKYVETDGSTAAIASERAAHLYGLPIFAKSIQDYADNCTRFLAVSQPQSSVSVPEISAAPVYTSLAFSLPQNAPGALVAQLQVFAARGINLSRIESRPTKRSLGEYVFFIDAEASLETDAMQSAVDLLDRSAERLKVLGSYSTIKILPTDLP